MGTATVGAALAAGMGAGTDGVGTVVAGGMVRPNVICSEPVWAQAAMRSTHRAVPCRPVGVGIRDNKAEYDCKAGALVTRCRISRSGMLEE